MHIKCIDALLASCDCARKLTSSAEALHAEPPCSPSGFTIDPSLPGRRNLQRVLSGESLCRSSHLILEKVQSPNRYIQIVDVGNPKITTAKLEL